MIGKNLQHALGVAINEVRRRRHEYLTLEHLLYGIASENAGRRIIERCGGSAAVVRQALDQFFARYMEIIDEEPTEI